MIEFLKGCLAGLGVCYLVNQIKDVVIKYLILRNERKKIHHNE